MNRKLICFCALALGVPGMSLASDRLINVDGPSVTPTGGWRLGMSAGLHRGQEDRSYVSFDGRLGLEHGWELGFRGAFAPTGRANTAANIRSGGSDVELRLRYALPQVQGLTLGGGISFPHTPAQDTPFATYDVSYQVPMALTQYKFFVGSRGVLRSGSTIIGVSGGVTAPLGPGLELVGDVTAIVRGVNSRNGNSGAAVRRAVYGFGLRYQPMTLTDKFDWSVYVGMSNALGLTTGTSLSSALGNQPALTLGFVVRGKS